MDFDQTDPEIMIVSEEGGGGSTVSAEPPPPGAFDFPQGEQPILPPEDETPVSDPFKMPNDDDMGILPPEAIAFDGSQVLQAGNVEVEPKKSASEAVSVLIMAAILGFVIFKFFTRGR